ncbi:hypothetical protein X777_09636 [Ooceraea biroi]|uniref:Uncharacterized protein n=1 Tax=Ooceraea biroi TaxID=2015173 RepID=A0A026W866_OOCBI|nr:hypothetical protein X777_09636 [Ooceraea biroi]
MCSPPAITMLVVATQRAENARTAQRKRDERTDRQIDRRTDRQTDRRMNE